MLEFSNLVKVTPTSSPSSHSYEFVADTFTYAPQLADSEAGTYWNCDKTLIVELPDSPTLEYFSIERNAIVTLKGSDRRLFNIGTREIPARVQISPNLTSAHLVIKCKMLKSPLI